MKLLLSALSLVVCLGVVTSSSGSWGNQNPSDKLLLWEEITRYPQWSGSWIVKVNYPKVGAKITNKTISAIHVIERSFERFSAIPSLESGGVGQKRAVVTLTSHPRRGIHTVVEFWGH